VLQEHEVRPVGAGDAREVDVRIVAATNRSVQDLLAAADFRRDLLYRLSVINIELPPLRHRREDIPLLVEHFLQRLNARLGKHVVAPAETIAWLSATTKSPHGNKAVNEKTGYGIPSVGRLATLSNKNVNTSMVMIGWITAHDIPNKVCLYFTLTSRQTMKETSSR
jgi:sigma54-dependent transcription regulator